MLKGIVIMTSNHSETGSPFTQRGELLDRYDALVCPTFAIPAFEAEWGTTEAAANTTSATRRRARPRRCAPDDGAEAVPLAVLVAR
jgi:hypothetical protein